MKYPHKNLPPNDLPEQDHRKAGRLAKSLMSKPAKDQKQGNRKHAQAA